MIRSGPALEGTPGAVRSAVGSPRRPLMGFIRRPLKRRERLLTVCHSQRDSRAGSTPLVAEQTGGEDIGLRKKVRCSEPVFAVNCPFPQRLDNQEKVAP